MKLLSVMTTEGPRLAARVASGILVFSHAAGVSCEKLPTTLEAALASEGGLRQLLPDLQAVVDHEDSTKAVVPESAVRIVRPYLPSNVIAVGLNYREHAPVGPREEPGYLRTDGPLSGHR